MSKTINCVLIAAMIGGAVFTYDTKLKAEAAAKRVIDLRDRLAKEQTGVSMAKAEWSVLTQPARLERLAGLYKSQLGLNYTDVSQIGTVDDVPVRATVADIVGSAKAGASAGGKSIAGLISGGGATPDKGARQ